MVTFKTIFKINPVLEVEDFQLLVRGGQTNSAFCLHEYEVVEAGNRADNPMVISNKSIILKPVVVSIEQPSGWRHVAFGVQEEHCEQTFMN